MMENEQKRKPEFIVGGRYFNRRGEYEVLDIQGDKLKIRYDDGQEQKVSATLQARIIDNMIRQAFIAAPYPSTMPRENETYFFTLGFLCKRATMMEAIVPQHSLNGFVADYLQHTGRIPQPNDSGFYVHPPLTDKWGCELRLTFSATQEEVDQLDFGPDVHYVVNPASIGSSWRINNNGYWWRLVRQGFRMGTYQDFSYIKRNIPHLFTAKFDEGYANASI